MLLGKNSACFRKGDCVRCLRDVCQDLILLYLEVNSLSPVTVSWKLAEHMSLPSKRHLIVEQAVSAACLCWLLLLATPVYRSYMERPRWLLHVQWVGVIAEDHLGLEMHLSQQAVNVSLDAGNPSSQSRL